MPADQTLNLLLESVKNNSFDSSDHAGDYSGKDFL